MKLIHTSDWHIGRTLAQYSLIDDQRRFLDQLTQFAVSQQADAVLVAGDVYNRAVPSSQAVELLDEALSRLVLEHRIPVIAVAGNHDSPERLSFASRMLRESGLYVCGTLGERMETVTLGKGPNCVVCYLLPYFTPAQVRALYGEDDIATANDAFLAILRHNKSCLDPSRTNILIAHGFFSRLGERQRIDPIFSESELSIGTLDVIDVTIAAELFDYVALGHLHAPQRLGSDFVRYAGSPLKYSLSEARQIKSVVSLQTGRKGEMAVRTQTFKALHDVRVIEGPFDKLSDPKIQRGTGLQDYVYANIVGDDAVLYAMQKLRAVFPNILGLSFLGSAQQAQRDAAPCTGDLAAHSVQELFAQFYQQVAGAPLEGRRESIVRRLARESEEASV